MTEQTEGGEMVTISLKIPRPLKAEIDRTWEERLFPNRSEFLRQALRDAVQPERPLSPRLLAALRETEGELDAGETVSLEGLSDLQSDE